MNRLDSHDIIAWDFDETLIDNEHSTKFHDYILSNQDKEHWIVTFRDKQEALRCFPILRFINNDLTSDKFKGLIFLGEEIAATQNILPYEIRYGDPNSICEFTLDILKKNNISIEKYKEIRNIDLYWKGKKCKDISATVMVDDLEHAVKPGCDFYGIEFINSKDIEI